MMGITDAQSYSGTALDSRWSDPHKLFRLRGHVHAVAPGVSNELNVPVRAALVCGLPLLGAASSSGRRFQPRRSTPLPQSWQAIAALLAPRVTVSASPRRSNSGG